ncbi:hypothetical protein [Segniliparus rotundus]|nr:hypothetical protein [Segniliparus rotundus]
MKQKGDRAEREAGRIAGASGFPWWERMKAGAERDRGDLTLCPYVIAQVKDCKRISIPEWLRQLAQQKRNARADVAVLVVKHSIPGKAPVWSMILPYQEGLRLLRQAGWGEPVTDEPRITEERTEL